jgi:hypothetical protein
MEEQAALARKEQTITYIGESLANTHKLKLDHCYIKRDMRLREQWEPQALDLEDDMYDSDNDETLNAGIMDI